MKICFYLLVIASLLLSACQALPPAPTSVPSPVPSMIVVSPGTASSTVAPADVMVQLAKDLLREQFGVSPADIAVAKVTSMTWPDRSLGCPKIGVMYIPLATSGYEIVLKAKGHDFTVHAGEPGIVVLCAVDPPDAAFPTP